MSLEIYYHGASNDKVDDPDNKKILPPSSDHPFFVSPDPRIAIRYAMMPTGNDGRLADVNKNQEHVYENSRVYLVRLDTSKLNVFDIFTRRDINKLSKFYSQEAIDELYSLFVSDDYTIMRICIMLSNCLKSDSVIGPLYKGIYDKLANSNESKFLDLIKNGLDFNQKKELLNIYRSYLDRMPPVYLFLFLDMIKYFLDAKLIDDSFFSLDKNEQRKLYSKNHKIDRRDVKRILFNQIRELGYNAIVERNTFYSNNRSKNELAILDIEPIVDGYPKAIKLNVLEKIIDDFHDSGKNNSEFVKYLLSKL